MNSNTIEGKANEVAGKVKEAAGDVTGSQQLKAEGTMDQVAGVAQGALGKAEDVARDYIGDDAVDKAKDAAERVVDQGRRYADAGRRYVDDQIDRYPDARRAIDSGRSSIAEQVREAPLLALVLAGAVGFGLGLLMNRSDERHGGY